MRERWRTSAKVARVENSGGRIAEVINRRAESAGALVAASSAHFFHRRFADAGKWRQGAFES